MDDSLFPQLPQQTDPKSGDEGRDKHMAINLQMPEVSELKPRITVFGVGGAGGNAVNNMIESGLAGCDFVVANTDAQALASSKAERVVQMGVAVTEGLGAGSMPEIGGEAAREVLDELNDHLTGSHMVFITAGMGGGTGTGAAPVIAKAAREMGILTVGVVTKPFFFEGQRRMRVADAGIEELQHHVDTLIVIPNQNLFRIANEKTTFADAFAMADQVLYSGVACITDLMVKEGLINLDFADVRSIMRGMGKAMMGTGEATGDSRSIQAAEAAIANPLLDETSMRGAQGLLISITGGKDMTLYEVDEAATRIREEVDQDANIILGATFDDAVEGAIRVSVVATGIDKELTSLEDTETRLQKDAAERVRKSQEEIASAASAPARQAETATQAAVSQAASASVTPLPVTAPATKMTTANPITSSATSRVTSLATSLSPAPTTLPQLSTEAVLAAKMSAEFDVDLTEVDPASEAVAVSDDPEVTILPYKPDDSHSNLAEALEAVNGTPRPPVDEPLREAFVPPAPEAPSDQRIPPIEEFPFIAQREMAAERAPRQATGQSEQRPMSLLKRLAHGFNAKKDEEGDGGSEEPAALTTAATKAKAPAAHMRSGLIPQTGVAQAGAASPQRQRQAELDPMGRQMPQRVQSEDDNLEIPAFLRRQSS